MRNLKFLVAFALLCLFVSAIGPANAGVANPPNIPLPSNPAGWCSATTLVPGTVRTTQIGDCPAPPPDTCPAGRQTQADVCYSYGPSNCANRTDVTKYDNVWGRGRPTDPITPFPGRNVFAIFKNLQKTGYVALQFTVPATGLSPQQFAILNHAATTGGPNLSASISTRCGDFTPPSSVCRAANVGNGANMLAWKLPGYAGPALCPIAPAGTYYLNIKITSPDAPAPSGAVGHFDCSGSVCRVNVQNNRTP